MHESVLLKESITYLNLKKDSIVVDATLGYGGHSSEILKNIPNGYLYCFDQDIEAINYSQKRLEKIASNFEIIKSNFSHLKEKLKEKNIEKVDAIFFDLGVSSPQLDCDYRGFSFHKDAKLDMRMDQSQSLDAYQVVNTYSKEELTRIFFEYGEEKYASKIASAIVKTREEKLIETTFELVDVIKNSVPEKYKREKHPARKVFQAIRIEVNHELEVLKIALKDALTLLNPGGRIGVITFHSLEDKICKRIFQEVSKVDSIMKELPIVPEEYKKEFQIVKQLKPSKKEIEKNNRARSSKLRVIERIEE